MIVQLGAAFLNIVEVAAGFHLAGIHREVGRCHLLFHHALQTARSSGRVENELVLAVLVQGTKERNSLDVIPMKMGNEDVGRDRPSVRLAFQLLPQCAKPGAAIKNVEAVSEADLDAGSVSSVAQVPGLGGGRGPTPSPELDLHTPPFPSILRER